MSDVTAVVFSIGEKTTQRAIDSLKSQSLQPKDIVLIENITPSYRAGNLGASKVHTDYLIIVGADMILDSYCVESLRKCMLDKVGIVLGHLRDPIRGRIQGIKLYRKVCFEIAQLPNTISPDTDFYNDLFNKGMHMVYALHYNVNDNKFLHTFGDHKPGYTPLYTFSKFTLEGRRSSYRQNIERLKWWIHTLVTSNHSMSFLALIAMCNGFFKDSTEDLLQPYENNDDFNFLIEFMNTKNDSVIGITDRHIFTSKFPEEIFKYYYTYGMYFRKSKSFPAFRRCLLEINKINSEYDWMARLGLCRGVFQEQFSYRNYGEDFKKFSELI